MYVFPDKHGLFLDMVCLLSRTLDLDEGVKLDHGLRVAQLSQAIARQLNHDEPAQLFIAGLLHDIGGMGLKDHVLHHALDNFQDMEARAHASRGASILKSFQPFEPLVGWVADHHERYDGTGFPGGKSKLGISSEAGILHLADFLDIYARTHPQATREDVRSFILKQSATGVAPVIVEAARRLFSSPESIALLHGVVHTEELCSEMDIHLPGLDSLSVEEMLCQLLWLVAQVADSKEVEKRYHSIRVAFYSHRIAKSLNHPEADPLQVLWAGLLHDIGMIAVPRNELNQRCLFPAEESGTYRQHAQVSADLVSQIEGLSHLSSQLTAHHEHWDGSGFPGGLQGKEIPLVSRILGIADHYDHLAGEIREGRRVRHQQAMDELKKGRGKLFDPELLDIALPVLEVWGPYDISWIRDLSNVYAFFVSDPFDRISTARESGRKNQDVESTESDSLPRQWALAWIARDFEFLSGAEAICNLADMDVAGSLCDILDSSVWNETQKKVSDLPAGVSLTLSLPTRKGRLLELLFISQEDWFELLYRGVNEAPLFTRKHSLFYQNFRSTPDAELLIDRNAVIRDANSGALMLLGFSLQELLGKGIEILFSPFLSISQSRSLQRFFNVHAQDVWSEEFSLANGEGRYCTLQVTVQRLLGGSDRQLSFLGRLRDVSAQKKMERDMAQRDRALQLIVHNTSGLTGEKFFESLLHQFVVLVKSKIAMVGELVDDGKGIRPLVLWEQGKFQKVEPFSLQESACKLVVKKGEVFFSRRLREFFPSDLFLQKRGLNSCWGLPLRRQDGTIIGILVAMDEKDIIRSTSMQVIVRVLQSLAVSELARLQTERVLQENERQLEKQNRELTRMNQLKSDMIAVTSHDLKSPLSAIIGYASLLEQYFLTLTEEKKIYYIKRIEEEGQKQLVFINQLLDLYRIESGSIQLEYESQRLDLFVVDCIATQKHVAAARNIVFDFRRTGEMVPLLFDRMRMDQVFSNLLSNAVKFSPDDEIIKVCYSQDERFASVEICDRGKGIDEEEISHIFDRYYMGRTDFEVRAEGAGLGLYIVKNIVTLHGGEVCAKNRKKGGSCFTVRLPVEMSGTENG